MGMILQSIRRTPVLWLLVFVPVVFVAETAFANAHTLLFVLSVLAIVPLASLLSLSTEAVAERTGDAVGGLLNATLGNLTELIIAIAALRAGQYMLVKASLAGAIVTNTLFMMGAAFLLGGLRYKVQEFNRPGARFQTTLLFLSVVALMAPSAVGNTDALDITADLSLAVAILLIVTYALGLLFTLGTHREYFKAAEHEPGAEHEKVWPIGVALAALGVTTVFVALISEIFVESVQRAAVDLGLSAAFIGFVVVALVGGAAEMTAAFSAARRNRLDLSVSISFGSATQIALLVAPVLVLISYVVGPQPMDLQFWPGALVMIMVAALTAFLVTEGGRSAWFSGVLMLTVYLVFAITLYMLPPTPMAALP
jgi:Ca2+:H+ antiporter